MIASALQISKNIGKSSKPKKHGSCRKEKHKTTKRFVKLVERLLKTNLVGGKQGGRGGGSGRQGGGRHLRGKACPGRREVLA